MDAITRFIAPLFPSWAASRIAAQGKLEAAKRYYEAVNTSAYRGRRGGSQSADTVMDRSKGKLREFARFLDENLDLAVGILDDLTVNIIGQGVGVEPTVRRNNGDPDHALDQKIHELWLEFWQRPTVDQQLSGPEFERMACRTWLRDGEIFAQHVINRAGLRYPNIPYLLEPLEADFCPFDLTTDNITQGVQKNAWGQPTAYVIYKQHPGALRGGFTLETKIIPAEAMLHLKFARRLHQTRGVSIFHAVLNRLDDIKDYEESERIAARIAAAFTAFIRRNGEYETPLNSDGSRSFEMSPGMVFDNLLPGEDVGMINSDRPNSGLENFRNSQLRAVSAGTHTRFSSIAKNYNGTYSAQRQELIEGSLGYRRLFNVMLQDFYLPIWRRFIDAAQLSGALRIPSSVNMNTVYRPEFRPPATAWIDPKKELDAFKTAVECGFKSRHQVIRDMGGDPRIVDAQLEADQFDARPGQSTDPNMEAPIPAAKPSADDDEDEELQEAA